MPAFSTISPTCKAGGKEEAWLRFRDGGYVAIGWCYRTNLTGMTIDEIIDLIPKDHVANKRDYQDAVRSFRVFWELMPGDYLAVRNTNDGLFGVGVIQEGGDEGYHYERCKHFTGEEKQDYDPLVKGHWYPHFYNVKWVWTDYIKRERLDIENGDNWIPFGTLSQRHEKLPSYILPYLMTNADSPK